MNISIKIITIILIIILLPSACDYKLWFSLAIVVAVTAEVAMAVAALANAALLHTCRQKHGSLSYVHVVQ